MALVDRKAEGFPHHRLDAYVVAREVVGFVAANRQRWRGLPGEAGPQLERAVVSAMLNVAEAAGRQGVRDRARVFALARGEVLEAEAALDVAVLFGAIGDAEAAPVRALMARLGQMLSRLSR
ncbi:MAG TPA: four helix bundle protein [Myxococcota bacterium]|jgi:four helix bundle protein|nr:four helix bundle protein [Myxococcota bacterium]